MCKQHICEKDDVRNIGTKEADGGTWEEATGFRVKTVEVLTSSIKLEFWNTVVKRVSWGYSRRLVSTLQMGGRFEQENISLT